MKITELIFNSPNFTECNLSLKKENNDFIIKCPSEIIVINEVFNYLDEKNRFPYTVEQISPRLIKGTVILDGQNEMVPELEMFFLRTNKKYGSWDLSFRRNLSYNITGDKNEYKVFNTVFHFFEQQIKKYRPKYLTFSATPTEPNRVKLYNTFVRVLVPKILPEYIRVSEVSFAKLLLPKNIKPEENYHFVLKRRG